MIKIMAGTETVNNPAITLRDAELAAATAEILSKLDIVILDLAEVSGQLARLDTRFAVVEAEVRPLLEHPWVARFRNKAKPR